VEDSSAGKIVLSPPAGDSSHGQSALAAPVGESSAGKNESPPLVGDSSAGKDEMVSPAGESSHGRFALAGWLWRRDLPGGESSHGKIQLAAAAGESSAGRFALRAVRDGDFGHVGVLEHEIPVTPPRRNHGRRRCVLSRRSSRHAFFLGRRTSIAVAERCRRTPGLGAGWRCPGLSADGDAGHDRPLGPLRSRPSQRSRKQVRTGPTRATRRVTKRVPAK
jgi:hypothetical protein